MTLYGPLRTLSIISPFGSLSKTLEQPYRLRVFFFYHRYLMKHIQQNHGYWWWIQQCQVLKTLRKSSLFVKLSSTTRLIPYYLSDPCRTLERRKKKHLYILNERDGQGLITNINCNIHRLFVWKKKCGLINFFY